MSKVNSESRKFIKNMNALKLRRIKNIIGEHSEREKEIKSTRIERNSNN